MSQNLPFDTSRDEESTGASLDFSEKQLLRAVNPRFVTSLEHTQEAERIAALRDYRMRTAGQSQRMIDSHGLSELPSVEDAGMVGGFPAAAIPLITSIGLPLIGKALGGLFGLFKRRKKKSKKPAQTTDSTPVEGSGPGQRKSRKLKMLHFIKAIARNPTITAEWEQKLQGSRGMSLWRNIAIFVKETISDVIQSRLQVSESVADNIADAAVQRIFGHKMLNTLDDEAMYDADDREVVVGGGLSNVDEFIRNASHPFVKMFLAQANKRNWRPLYAKYKALSRNIPTGATEGSGIYTTMQGRGFFDAIKNIGRKIFNFAKTSATAALPHLINMAPDVISNALKSITSRLKLSPDVTDLVDNAIAKAAHHVPKILSGDLASVGQLASDAVSSVSDRVADFAQKMGVKKDKTRKLLESFAATMTQQPAIATPQSIIKPVTTDPPAQDVQHPRIRQFGFGAKKKPLAKGSIISIGRVPLRVVQ